MTPTSELSKDGRIPTKQESEHLGGSMTSETGDQVQGVTKEESLSNKEKEKPQPPRSLASLVVLLASVLLSMSIVGLDRTIIATAMPRITDEFNSFDDIGWYGGSYLLTSCALQLLYGKVYTIFSIKWVLLGNIVFFEGASALCGAAPNSVAFIIGRAFMGIGAAGISAGVLICIAYTVPLEKRSLVQALFGALVGIAAICGPMIGGALTSNVTWRWCFYINLPVGAVAILAVLLFLKDPERDTTKGAIGEKLKQLDAIGTTLLVPGVICLLLALQWGGQTYAWNDGRIIALLTLSPILMICFITVQIVMPRTATVPTRILKQRSIAAAFWVTFMLNCGSFIIVYFLPIWFQAVQGVSATQSGIRILPVMISTIVGTIGGGFINLAIGYYTPLAIVGACIMSVGSGLLTTLQVDTSFGKWFGFQVIYGLGFGVCFQVPNLAAQTVLPQDDVPTGLALMMFGSLISAAIFVPIGQNVLGNQLVQRLSWITGFDPSLVTSGGVTSLLDALPENLRATGLYEYNEALRRVFLVSVVPNCLSVIGTAFLEWKSIKKDKEAKDTAEDTGSAEETKMGEAAQ